MNILIILPIIGILIPIVIVIMDRFVITLPDTSKFKKWWINNIIGNENK
jgi:hypothetical protein